MVVALEGEGAKVVSEAGAGWVVPPENPQALAQAVLAASQASKSQLETMGNLGEKYFNEQFERSVVLGRLERVLVETAGASI
jgi:colanic acid biosynthesis glycosyl transferase WcaI